MTVPLVDLEGNDEDEVRAACGACGWRGPWREWIRQALDEADAHEAFEATGRVRAGLPGVTTADSVTVMTETPQDGVNRRADLHRRRASIRQLFYRWNNVPDDLGALRELHAAIDQHLAAENPHLPAENPT